MRSLYKTRKNVIIGLIMAIITFLLLSMSGVSSGTVYADDNMSVGTQYFHTSSGTLESFINKSMNRSTAYKGIRTEFKPGIGNTDVVLTYNGLVDPTITSVKNIIEFDYETRGQLVADAIVISYTAISDPTKQISIISVNRQNRCWVTVAFTDELELNDGYMYIKGTDQKTIGYRDQSSYSDIGYCYWASGEKNWGAVYGQSNIYASISSTGTVYINDSTYAAENIADADFLDASSKNLSGSEFENRYTANYVSEIISALKDGSFLKIKYFGLKATKAAFNIRALNGVWFGDTPDKTIPKVSKAYSEMLTDSLYEGETYNVSDVIKRYSAYRNSEGTDVSYYNGWYSYVNASSETTPNYFCVGFNKNQNSAFTVPENVTTYTIKVNSYNADPVVGNVWGCSQIFTFNVTKGEPTIEENGVGTFLEGQTYDLKSFFKVNFIGSEDRASYEFYIDGLSVPQRYVADGQGHVLKLIFTDSRGYKAEKTIYVQSGSIYVPERIEHTGYYGKPVVLPVPKMSNSFNYTLRLEKDGRLLSDDIYFIFEDEGEYDVIYSFDVPGTERIVKTSVLDISLVYEKPIITVADNYKDNYYIGEQIVIFDATATDGDKTYEVFHKVFVNDKETELDETFTAKTAGKYSIIYFCNSSDGQKTEKVCTFNVVLDTQPPTLFISGSYAQSYPINSTIYLLDAVAYDNFGIVSSLTVNVFFNNNAIEVQDNQIKFDKKGVYKIVYTAVDESGLSNSESFEITVKDDDNSAHKGCGSSATGNSAGVILAFIAVGVVFTVVKKKERD